MEHCVSDNCRKVCGTGSRPFAGDLGLKFITAMGLTGFYLTECAVCGLDFVALSRPVVVKAARSNVALSCYIPNIHQQPGWENVFVPGCLKYVCFLVVTLISLIVAEAIDYYAHPRAEGWFRGLHA